MNDFRIAAAQVSSVRGELASNVDRHVAAIAAAGSHGISVLIFPELSLIGYEPDLAAEFSLQASDERLVPIARAAEQHRMQVVVGSPLASGQQKPYLGAIVCGPDQPPQTYAKMHLGGREPDYFTPGEAPKIIESHGHRIGLSICADSSKQSHPAGCATLGASVYAASVFLNEEWYTSDSPRFGRYASEHRMLVLMANHGSSTGTLVSVGKSAAWTPDGSLLVQVKGTEDALIMATKTHSGWIGEVASLR